MDFSEPIKNAVISSKFCHFENFFYSVVSKKRTAVNTMTEQEKEQILRKMKNREQGDVASNDDDLVRSEKYMKKGQYARSKYKEFYDDVKLSIKEDW